MLFVDLHRLRREGRVRIDAEIPTDALFWEDLDVSPQSPLEVRLEAQQAGADVVVRGEIRGRFGLSCRRCLAGVTRSIDEELGVLYRDGEVEDAGGDVLALPEHGTELDLTPVLREQVLLAVPQYAYCREECQGLCPHCGANLNEATCDCRVEELDDRWAPLRQLRKET